MAITGPSELPLVLKVDSDPIKKYVISKLGHPVTEVELSEDQWETILRTSGDFIAHYFSKEQMFGVFWTQPLVSDYDLPDNAYWVQEVAWDPVTTRIDKIFGAESFLFCFAPGFMILRDDNRLIDVRDWEPEYKCVTPYGNKKLIVERHLADQEIMIVNYDGGSLHCTPNHPIKINDVKSLDNWKTAEELEPDDKLVTVDDNAAVISVSNGQVTETYSVFVPAAHCFYGCHGDGDNTPILVH